MAAPDLDDPKIRRLVERVDLLPTMPAIAHEIASLVHNPRTTIADLVRVMKNDGAITARILRVVNSPYFGIPGGVSDLDRAIGFLGFTALYQIVLTVSVYQTLDADATAAKQLFAHSMATGACARSIAKFIRYPEPNVCFTAGLLHDLGRLVLLNMEPEQFVESAAYASERGVSTCQAEIALGLPSHQWIGERLATRWRFPETLCAAVAHHHASEDEEQPAMPPFCRMVVDVVSVANDVCSGVDDRAHDDEAFDIDEYHLPGDVLERIGWSPSVHHDEVIRAGVEKSLSLASALAP